MTPQDLTAAFLATFGPGRPLTLVKSPGRVNLIGEHTDYNDGFVFPMAIGPHLLLAGRARTDGKVIARSTLKIDGRPVPTVEFSINEPITTGSPTWGNYVRGAIAMLKRKGVPLVGMEVLVDSNLPSGGGLSSSAAMEVGVGRLMLALAGESMDNLPLALLCQAAEHEFANTPCGIMDQMIVASGVAGHAMLLDCRTKQPTFAPLGDDATVVVVNSMVEHKLGGDDHGGVGEYEKRRRSCETGVAYFQKTDPKIKALRDVTLDQVNAAKADLDDVVFRRCRHVVTEIDRCLKFAELLKASDLTAAGKLMYASHASLRDDYEVSVEELDFLVDTAAELEGVYGSRMTGGGFGGCTVSLVKPAMADKFLEDIAAAFKAKYGRDPVRFKTPATDGTAIVG